MITDEELAKLFPNGAMMIPLSGAPSVEVMVGGSQYAPDPEDAHIFEVWVSHYKEMRVSREVTHRDGGIEADSSIGPIFLRPMETNNS